MMIIDNDNDERRGGFTEAKRAIAVVPPLEGDGNARFSIHIPPPSPFVGNPTHS